MGGSNINRVCAEALSHKVQLVGYNKQSIKCSSPEEYMFHCEDIFRDAQHFHRYMLHVPPTLILPSHMRHIGDFAKRRNLKARLLGYTSSNPSFLSATAGTINISPRVPCRRSKWLSWFLDHEYGHVRDFELIVLHDPRLKAMFTKRERITRSEIKRYILVVLKLMRDGLCESDRVEFCQLKAEVLGYIKQYDDESLLTIARQLAEFFRRGEEVLDKRFKDFIMDPDYPLLTVDGHDDTYYLERSIINPRGERVDLGRLYSVASLMETGLWKEFIGRYDNDADTLRYIQPNHLKFFRLCIRGATRYFINTAAR